MSSSTVGTVLKSGATGIGAGFSTPEMFSHGARAVTLPVLDDVGHAVEVLLNDVEAGFSVEVESADDTRVAVALLAEDEEVLVEDAPLGEVEDVRVRAMTSPVF